MQAEAAALRLLRTLDALGNAEDFVLYSTGATVHLAYGVQRRAFVCDRHFIVEDDSGRHEELATDPVRQLGRVLERWNVPAFGYLAFDLARFAFDYPHSISVPLCFMAPTLLVSIEPDGHLVVRPAVREREVQALLAREIGAELSTPIEIDPTRGRDDYRAKLSLALSAVRARDLAKVIVSRRQEVPGHLDVAATYEAALANAAARRFAFRLNGLRGVGSCPEILLHVDAAGAFVTNPLAGTKPRGKTPEEDAALARELLEDPKEVHEHALSVRDVQDEVAKLAAPGTFRIFEFLESKEYPFTRHLSSRLGGLIAPGHTAWDVVRAVFPGVTVTGVPRARAIALLGSIEGTSRGVYGGAVGMFGPGGTLDLGISIRSVFEQNGTVSLSAGAGIVSESKLDDELVESENKMRTIARALRLVPHPRT